MAEQNVRNGVVVGSAVVAAAAVGSIATDPNSAWYRALNKPPWQPPPAAFPVAWTALYGTIAVTSTKTLNELHEMDEEEEATSYRGALLLNLVLNALWSWLFFRKKDLPAAVAGAAALTVSSVDLARRAGRVRAGYGLVLLPYAVWTAFATTLTVELTRRNR